MQRILQRFTSFSLLNVHGDDIIMPPARQFSSGWLQLLHSIDRLYVVHT